MDVFIFAYSIKEIRVSHVASGVSQKLLASVAIYASTEIGFGASVALNGITV